MNTYVIVNKNKWEDIKYDFSDTNINLIKWNIPKSASKKYNTFCSRDTINRWIAHRSLWQKIYKSKEKYAIILEDDAVPISNFEQKLNTLLSEAPNDWDLLYIGCTGSCDVNSFAEEVLVLYLVLKINMFIKTTNYVNILLNQVFRLGHMHI